MAILEAPPPKIKRSSSKTTPTTFTARQKASNPCGEPTVTPQVPGGYDVFYGPFDSWYNVKNPPPEVRVFGVPAAVGDGIADDTEAIQAALDYTGQQFSNHVEWELGSGFYLGNDPGWRHSKPGFPKGVGNDPMATWGSTQWGCCYFPAGIYRITKTLRVYNRFAHVIIGEDPTTTVLFWDGNDWANDFNWLWAGSDAFDGQQASDLELDILLIDGGGTSGSVRRIGFDGNNHKCRLAFNMAGSTGGMEGGNYEDLHIRNCAAGIKWGYNGLWTGANDADAPVKRCIFDNLVHFGVSVIHYNTLNMICWDCLFRRCSNAGYMGAGSIFYYNCLFLNCYGSDMYYHNNQVIACRGNTSIRTADRPPQSWETSQAFSSSNYYSYWSGASFQGNLVINAQSTPWVTIGGIGACVLSDNAFYDHFYLTNEFVDPDFPLFYWQRNAGNGVSPLNAEFSEGTSIAVYYSGNVYNGKQVDVSGSFYPPNMQYHVMSDGYVPPNLLNITQSEIRSLLTVSEDDPLIADIISRMPPVPPRIDPYSTEVKLTEINVSMNAQQALNDAISTAVPDKMNLVHFAKGDYSLNQTFEFPGVPWAIVGDSIGLNVNYGYYPPGDPLFIFHPNASGAVKLRIDEMTLGDLVQAPLAWVTDIPSILINSGDMTGGRVYIDNMWSGGPLIGGGVWEEWGSRNVIQGFDKLRVRYDTSSASAIYCRGTGKQVTKDEDCVVQYYQLTMSPAVGQSHFYVSNGGSIHVHDQYCENIYQALNLEGGNGYFVWENPTKYHVNEDAGIEGMMSFATNFTGHQLYLTWVGSDILVNVDVPAAGSSTTVWGLNIWPPWTPLGIQLQADFGLPQTWQRDVDVDPSLFLGLTTNQSQNSPNNLFVAGNHAVVRYLADYETRLMYDVPATGAAPDPDWPYFREFIGVESNAGFYEFHSGFQVVALAPAVVIDDESVGQYGYMRWYIAENWPPFADGTIVWEVVRQPFSPAHSAGAIIKRDPAYGSFYLVFNFAPLPVGGTPPVFPDIAKDALKYKPFPQPPKITDPTLTDVVLHRMQGGTRRYNWLKFNKQ